MLERFNRDAPHADVLAALDRDGAGILEGLVSPAEADALAQDFRPHLDAVPFCNTTGTDKDVFFGLKTKRLHGLTARSKRFGELIVHPTLLALAERTLLPHARDLRVSTGELMALGEGEGSQALHRDADSWYAMPRPRPEVLFSANVALTEFNLANGATVVAPGSHRWPPDRAVEPGETEQVVMSRGSALLYSGEVLHGGGPNTTEELRIGLYVGYIASWLRPIENHVLTNGLDAIRRTSERAQQLLDCGHGGWTPIA